MSQLTKDDRLDSWSVDSRKPEIPIFLRKSVIRIETGPIPINLLKKIPFFSVGFFVMPHIAEIKVTGIPKQFNGKSKPRRTSY